MMVLVMIVVIMMKLVVMITMLIIIMIISGPRASVPLVFLSSSSLGSTIQWILGETEVPAVLLVPKE